MPALYLHSYPVECVSVTFTHEEDDEIKVPPEVRVYAVVSDAEHKVLFVKFFYSKSMSTLLTQIRLATSECFSLSEEIRVRINLCNSLLLLTPLYLRLPDGCWDFLPVLDGAASVMVIWTTSGMQSLIIFCIGPLDTEAGMATLEKCDAEVRNLVLWYYFYQFQCLMILLQAPASMLVKSGGFIFLDASGHVVHVQVLSLDKVSPVMLTFGPASEASSDVSQQWWSIRVALSLFVVLYLT